MFIHFISHSMSMQEKAFLTMDVEHTAVCQWCKESFPPRTQLFYMQDEKANRPGQHVCMACCHNYLQKTETIRCTQGGQGKGLTHTTMVCNILTYFRTKQRSSCCAYYINIFLLLNEMVRQLPRKIWIIWWTNSRSIYTRFLALSMLRLWPKHNPSKWPKHKPTERLWSYATTTSTFQTCCRSSKQSGDADVKAMAETW